MTDTLIEAYPFLAEAVVTYLKKKQCFIDYGRYVMDPQLETSSYTLGTKPKSRPRTFFATKNYLTSRR